MCILISWLLQKPADLDLNCCHKHTCPNTCIFGYPVSRFYLNLFGARVSIIYSCHNEDDTLAHKHTHVKAKTNTMTLKAKQSTSMGEVQNFQNPEL